MKSIEQDINFLLAGWNPMDIDGHVALSEYKEYVPLIIRCLQDNPQGITIYLESLLKEKMGLNYTSNHPQHRLEIENISTSLISIYKQLS